MKTSVDSKTGMNYIKILVTLTRQLQNIDIVLVRVATRFFKNFSRFSKFLPGF